jgi:hypothetical protein
VPPCAALCRRQTTLWMVYLAVILSLAIRQYVTQFSTAQTAQYITSYNTANLSGGLVRSCHHAP